ncbi:MAG: hypothetical protein LBU64_08895 [Planctomycetota bacterium]|nr:hypothetical protein [Planctomycetota bacterium]
MTIRGKSNGNRGGVLLVVLLFSAVFAVAAGLYFFSVSHSAYTENTVLDNTASAQAHAEFAAGLAIANLGDVEFKTDERDGIPISVQRDWVARDPYGSGRFERRLAGAIGAGMDGYEYRVRVVPIREARKEGAVPESWHAGIDVPDYNFGADPIRNFTAAYDVTAVARHVLSDKKATMAGGGTVRTVASIKAQSAYNDLDKLATLHLDSPRELVLDRIAPAAALPSLAAGYGSTGGGEGVFKVAGEDHYSIKSVAKIGIIDKVVESLIRIKALPTEFFSVYNNWWTYGKQTVQFMVGDEPNPNIPRTRNIGRAAIDRQMIRLDPDRESDIYFNGGKVGSSDLNVDRFYPGSGWMSRHYRGRSVNIGEDGLIVETTESETIPTTEGLKAQKSLAVGSPENFLNVYFNYVDPFNSGTWVADNAGEAALRDWKRGWRQIMFAHHPKNATIITNNEGNKTYAAPRDNWKSRRRRRFPLLIMPMNADGAMLVREYDDTAYENPTGGRAVPPDKWYGTYTWMYRLGITTVAGTSAVRGYNGSWRKPTRENGTPSTETQGMKAMAPRAFSLQEFLGRRLTTDADGVPAKIVNGAIVAGVPDYELDGDGERVPYNPDPAGSQTNFNESWHRETREGDNWGVNEATIPLMPPTDGIYVRLQPGDPEYVEGFPGGVAKEGYWQAPAQRRPGHVQRYKRYQTVKDFAFQRNIGSEAEPDMRDVTSVFLSFDTNQEQDAAYFYYLLELSGSIVWAERARIAGEDPGELFRHWWEGEPREGLTGREPGMPISARADEDVRKLPSEEQLPALFKTMGIYDPSDPEKRYPDVNTMLDGADAMSGFNKVAFVAVGEESELGKPRDFNSWDSSSPVYFYGDDDLWGVATAMYAAKGLDMFTGEQRDALVALLESGDIEGYNERWTAFVKEQALERIDRYKGDYQFRHLSERFNGEFNRVQAVLSLESDGDVNPHLGKLLGMRSEASGRGLSLATFGRRRFRAPAVYVRESPEGTLTRMLQRDFNPDASGSDNMAPTRTMVTLLPGEYNPVGDESSIVPQGYDLEANPETYPWIGMMAKDNGALQINGRRIAPKFIWLENPPQTKSSPYARDLGMDDIRTPPEWFTAPDSETGVVLHDVMLRGDTILGMGGYNRERRGALGWHREGPGGLPPGVYGNETREKKVHELIFGDHYEYVIMTARESSSGLSSGEEPGLFPFVTMETTDADGKAGRYVALFRPEDEDPLTTPKANTFVPRLLPAGEMPTFVVEGEDLDGAGILVVNGNLHLRTRLSYHGVLIVLGNVLVEPRQYEMRDSLGNRMDAEGNPIKEVNGLWYVIDPHTLEVRPDSEGKPVQSKGGPVNEWRGGLIVQGKAVAGGKMAVTPEQANAEGEMIRPAGVIDIRASRQAVEDTMGAWIKVGPNEQIVMNMTGWSTGATVTAGESIWED